MNPAELETAFAAQLGQTLATCLESGQPVTRLILGFSGGADSTALLLLAARLSSAPPLLAAHLNHCLRGAESDADEDFCRSFCTAHQIPLITRKTDAAAYARENSLNLEDAARRLRRAFFAELAADEPGAVVLLAQHQDDQTETVLLRLLRGCGWRGLRGMSAADWLPRPAGNPATHLSPPVPVLRPLLTFPREQLTAYLREQKVAWREDSSNADLSFARNRLRRAVLPALELALPDCRARLLAAAHLASGVNQFIEEEAGAYLAQVREECGGMFLPLPQSTALHADPATQTIWLRAAEAVAERLPGGARLREENLNSLRELMAGTVRAVTLCGGIRARREAADAVPARHTSYSPATEGVFFFAPVAAPLPAITFNALEFEHADADCILSARLCELTGTLPDRENPWVEYFNPTRLRLPLTLRAPHPQERTLWRGESAPQTAGHLLKAHAIPPRYRARCRLLADHDGPLWLPPLRLSQRAACADFYATVLRVEFRHPVFHPNII